jgi:hypothetical protein
MDRAPDYESAGRPFEPGRVRQIIQKISGPSYCSKTCPVSNESPFTIEMGKSQKQT